MTGIFWIRGGRESGRLVISKNFRSKFTQLKMVRFDFGKDILVKNTYTQNKILWP